MRELSATRGIELRLAAAQRDRQGAGFDLPVRVSVKDTVALPLRPSSG